MSLYQARVRSNEVLYGNVSTLIRLPYVEVRKLASDNSLGFDV